jgi:hypothetical protein
MHIPPPLLKFLQKSALGIASDVATRRVALERGFMGHRQQQRRWQTMPMVSNWFQSKNRSEVEREF